MPEEIQQIIDDHQVSKQQAKEIYTDLQEDAYETYKDECINY